MYIYAFYVDALPLNKNDETEKGFYLNDKILKEEGLRVTNKSFDFNKILKEETLKGKMLMKQFVFENTP